MDAERFLGASKGLGGDSRLFGGAAAYSGLGVGQAGNGAAKVVAAIHWAYEASTVQTLRGPRLAHVSNTSQLRMSAVTMTHSH